MHGKRYGRIGSKFRVVIITSIVGDYEKEGFHCTCYFICITCTMENQFKLFLISKRNHESLYFIFILANMKDKCSTTEL
jgi:hypothetical protein